MEKRDTPVEVKVCSRCSHKKLNTEFYRDASKPDGLQVLPHALPHADCMVMMGPVSTRHLDCLPLLLVHHWHPRLLKH